VKKGMRKVTSALIREDGSFYCLGCLQTFKTERGLVGKRHIKTHLVHVKPRGALGANAPLRRSARSA
jgi:hypothetical protein